MVIAVHIHIEEFRIHTLLEGENESKSREIPFPAARGEKISFFHQVMVFLPKMKGRERREGRAYVPWPCLDRVASRRGPGGREAEEATGATARRRTGGEGRVPGEGERNGGGRGQAVRRWRNAVLPHRTGFGII